MIGRTRREFLSDVGRGMFAASLGSAAAAELGLAYARAGDEPATLSFGSMEPLVALMQDTPADRLLPLLTEKLAAGADLKSLVAAAALANARAFGGQDYTGYHALMALAPAFDMSGELPETRRALPVLKVLYRNTHRIQEQGGRRKEVLKPVVTGDAISKKASPEALRAASRQANFDEAERVLHGAMAHSPSEAYHVLQPTVHDDTDVHRVVLAWRAWVLLDFTGAEHAETLLRQSVRFCVDAERERIERKRGEPGIRAALPRLLDQYKLVSHPLGDRKPDDAWVEKLCHTIYSSNRQQAAEAVASALAEGFSPEVIGEAISLASARLVLHDPGRPNGDREKPKGSVHGASVGVHASDSANAWRNIARVGKGRDAICSLVVGAYHTAGQAGGQHPNPYPFTEVADKVTESDADTLLAALDEAVRAKDQPRACALTLRYGERGFAARPLFERLLGYAVSEDGALHAEKYYRTVCEEYATTRPAFRWRHLVALARVTASEYGFPAPGYQQACQLLKV